MAKAKPEPVRTTADMLATLAESLEAAAAAVRELETAGGVAPEPEVAEEPDEPVAPVATKKVAAKKAVKKAPAITFDELKDKMTDLLNLKGKEVVKSILSEFGVAKLVEVEESSYADLAAKIAEASAEDDEGGDGEEDLFGE